MVTAITGVSDVIENPSQETKEQIAGVVDNAIAAAKLGGTGVSGSYASNVLSLVATASSGRGGNNNKQKGRHLLEEPAAAAGTANTSGSSLPAAAVSLLGTLSGLAGLLSPSATPATGPSSAGDKGLYVTVANLVGNNLEQQVIAAGSVMGPPSSGSSSSGDSSMLVANATAAANVRLAFSGAFAGRCASDVTASGGQEEGGTAAGATSALCADGIVAVRLFYIGDAAVFLGEGYSSNETSSGSSSRRSLLAPVPVAGPDLELLSGSVYIKVGDQQQLPCDNSSSSNCSASVIIPLTSGFTPGDPQVQCLLLEGGTVFRGVTLADGVVTEAAGPASEDPAVSVAKCRVTRSGTYAVGRVQNMPLAPSATDGTGTADGNSTATVNGTDTSGRAVNNTGNGTDASNTTDPTPSPLPSPSPFPSPSPSPSPSPGPSQTNATDTNTTSEPTPASPSPSPSVTDGNTSDITINGTNDDSNATVVDEPADTNTTSNGTTMSPSPSPLTNTTDTNTTINGTTTSPSPSPSPQPNTTDTNTTKPEPTDTQTNATTSPSPSPSPFLPSPSPQLGLTDNTTAESPPTGKTHTVALAVTFPLDYLSLIADPDKEAAFKSGVVDSVATAAKVPTSWVTITQLSPGSVVADVLVTVPAATYSLNQAVELTAAVTAQPDVVFQQMKQVFGITGPIAAAVTATGLPPPPAHGGDSLALGLGVGIGVGGVVLLGVAWGLLLKRKRDRRAVHLVEFDATRGPPQSMGAAAAGGGSGAVQPGHTASTISPSQGETSGAAAGRASRAPRAKARLS